MSCCVVQSVESVVVFKSYDKSSGVSLRSSKVSSLQESSELYFTVCVCPSDEDPHDSGPEESQDY